MTDDTAPERTVYEHYKLIGSLVEIHFPDGESWIRGKVVALMRGEFSDDGVWIDWEEGGWCFCPWSQIVRVVVIGPGERMQAWMEGRDHEHF